MLGKTATKMIAVRGALFAVGLAALLSMLGQTTVSQPRPAASSAAAGIEFPVFLRQKIVAGITPVGTKVQAKLAVATLVNGVVLPEDAIFSGEVTESAAKSATSASRLSICVDSAHWKDGGVPKALRLANKVYLTAWYYPGEPLKPTDLGDEQPDSTHNPRHWQGVGATSPVPPSPASQPFPGRTQEKDPFPAAPASASASNISPHRVPMKNVEAARTADGAVTLSSSHSDIKLDRTTTYVLAAGDLAVVN